MSAGVQSQELVLESNPDLKTCISSITAPYFKLHNVLRLELFKPFTIRILSKNNTITDVSLYNTA
jgi:hypothetical protein